MAHIHEITDTEARFMVDATTREITNNDKLPALVQNDHNSEQFTFAVPRYVDSHDMSLCDKVEVLYENTDSSNKAKNFNSYKVKDLRVDSDDENTVILSWSISGDATQLAGSLSFSLRFYCEKNYVWNTKIFDKIKVEKGMPKTDDTGESEIDIAVNSAKEEYRSELETSIETATGESYDNKTWEELNETVATLPIISEEQTQALGDYDFIKAYFADYVGGWHDLFRNPPKDETNTGIEYRLPYIYTPKMKWAEKNCYISTDLLEFGVDVSSAINLGGATTGNTFQPLPKLQKLMLTGNANNPSCNRFMYNNSALVYLKMDTPSEEVLKANPSYYDTAFHSCSRLQTIDCELDFTGQTSTRQMLVGCTSLKNLRIKPFTLSTSLDLGACMSLHNNDLLDYGSLISILNGITNDREVSKNITITFSTQITDFTQGMVQFWNCNVFFGADSGLYYEKQPENEICLELSLYEAFTSKGVTIAWK